MDGDVEKREKHKKNEKHDIDISKLCKACFVILCSLVRRA